MNPYLEGNLRREFIRGGIVMFKIADTLKYHKIYSNVYGED